MRKAVVLAAILASSTAWAASGDMKDNSTSKSETNSRSSSTRHPAARVQGTRGSAKCVPTTPRCAEQARRSPRDWLSKDDFNLKGKVGRVSGRSVTIDRDNSTPATLVIDPATKIELDGKAARAADLKPGDDVKASFNLRGERPIALDLKASAKGK